MPTAYFRDGPLGGQFLAIKEVRPFFFALEPPKVEASWISDDTPISEADYSEIRYRRFLSDGDLHYYTTEGV